MHILCFSPRYYPAVGGAEIHLAEIIERFARDGHQVTVVTTDALDIQRFWLPDHAAISDSPPTHHNGVEIIRFPVQALPLTPLSYHAWRRGLWLLSRLPVLPTALATYLARYTPHIPTLWSWLKTTPLKPDVVFAMNICYESFLDAGRQFARQRDIPFVVQPLTHLGAGEAPGSDAQSGFYTMRHQRTAVLAADLVLTQSPTEQEFYKQYGGDEAKLPVASVCIDPQQYHHGNGRAWLQKQQITTPLIAYIGTHDYDKGTVHLIEAVAQLWEQGSDCELVLAGSQTDPFKAYIAQLPDSVRNRLHLLGRVSDAEKQDILTAMDLFVMPSRIDSFGIVYLESWFYKKPVIGAQAWGIADVIDDDQDGLLVPFGDVPALAEAIAKLLADPQKRQEMGANGRVKMMEKYTWENRYQEIAALFHNLVNEETAI